MNEWSIYNDHSIRVCGKWLRIHEVRSILVKVLGSKSCKNYENQYKSMKINENSLKTNVNPIHCRKYEQNWSPPSTKILLTSRILRHFPQTRMLTSLEIDPASISVEKTTLGRLYRATASRIGRGTPFAHLLLWNNLNKKQTNYI